MCFAPQRRALFRHRNFQKWSDHGFAHFDFKMCFAPQRRALFRHRNFQKWSDHGVFCAFWLQNVLRATTACTFSTSQLPKVVRHWCVLYILTSKCASRHNGVHFFMSHLASWLRTRRFSEPTFRPSGATNHWKNTVNRDFPIFSRICIFFLLILSLLTRLTSAFQLSILSEVSLLNFLRTLLWLNQIKSPFLLVKSPFCHPWFSAGPKPRPWTTTTPRRPSRQSGSKGRTAEVDAPINGLVSGTNFTGPPYRMGPPVDSVQLVYKWLNSMVYGRYNYS